MALKITLSRSEPLQVAVDYIVVGVPEGGVGRSVVLRELRKALGPMVGKALRRHEFSGKRDQAVELPTGGALKAQRLALLGLGPADDIRDSDVRRLVAKGARLATAARAASLGVLLPQGGRGAPIGGAIRAAAEGAVLGAYRYERYKTGDRITKHPLERIAILTEQPVDAGMRAEALRGQQVGEAVCIARDLINDPPNDLYPAALADFARQMCKSAGLQCTVLDEAALKKKGMHLLTAVGQGSARGPRLVHMKYRPAGKRELKKLVFVGKGLTFDSGGLCIKPAQGMEEMKGDMGGAANVIALMAAVAVRKPDAEVHGIIACAENMPDGKAYRPGDVFGSYDGKTVEIINTDAEGRLALADALAYARELEPDLLLDNATLTGACVVALGTTVSGFFTNREELGERVRRAARAAGEQLWQLPLVDDLREQLKSDWADLKNVGERWGGSITAALFLGEFVGDWPWVHVDIAGPSMANKAYDIYAKGGTGHPVLTYLELIDDFARPAAPAAASAEAERAP